MKSNGATISRADGGVFATQRRRAAALAALLLCFPFLANAENPIFSPEQENLIFRDDSTKDHPTTGAPYNGSDQAYKNVTIASGGNWHYSGNALIFGTLNWEGTITQGGKLTAASGSKNNINISNGAAFSGIVGRSSRNAVVSANAINFGKGTVQIPKDKVSITYRIGKFDFKDSPSEIELSEGIDNNKILTVGWTKPANMTNPQIGALFEVNAEPGYTVDHGNRKYLVTEVDVKPGETKNFSTTKSWALSYVHALNTGIASEAVMSAADNQRSLFNMWRLNDSYVFHRGDGLRRARQAYPGTAWRESDPQVSEGVWANVYKGKYSFDSPYGRKVYQDYQSIFLGFDKENEGDFHNGTLYRGVFFDLGKASAVYPTGKGDLDSKGLGAYLSWQGNHGHFWDAAFRIDKISNDYVYTDSAGTSDKNTYDTWAWGLSGQYGFTKTYDNGLYIEPVVGLSYGKLNPTSYTLKHSDLHFDQEGSDFLTGRAGFRIGKVTSDALGPYSTNVYARAMVSHDFLESGDAATTFGGDTLKVHTIGEKDTWTDLSVGIQRSFRQGSGYLELSKTVGGDVRSDWQIAAGLSFYWDPEPRYHGGPRHDEDVHSFSWNNAAGQVTDSAPRKGSASFAPAALPAAGTASAGTAAVAPQYASGTNAPAEGAQPEATGNASARTAAAPAPAYSQAGVYAAGDSGVFTLPGVTVEADRPQWEKNLSPGTVSVVYPDQYKGEMKGVPELLQTVSGVFVQKVNGTGHYTLARVRGSTGQQVSVYIDGVRMNSEGETGVDLSQIPSENIERIEVYKGYIPARFAGASIGGAINIVTKKPEGAHGSVSYGMKSFGGYTGGAEVTAPLGSGSLMVQVNRDQAEGGFSYMRNWQNNRLPDSPHFVGKYWRQDNWYRRTDAMVKWQDDHWLFKAQYALKNEGAPRNTYSEWGDNDAPSPVHSSQKNENLDLLFGRRQQTGDVEWGAYVNYGDHKKTNHVIGLPAEQLPAGANGYYNHKFYGARLDGSWKLDDSNLIEFLFNYSSETMDTDGNYYHRLEYSSHVDSNRQFLPKYDIKHYYFQIQDSMALDRRKTLIFTPEWRAEKMTMTAPGAKGKIWGETGDQPNHEDEWKYSYGLGLKKYVSDNWSFHGSYGTYYRAPNFYEMFGDGAVYVRPNPGTLGGTGLSWENGSQWDFGTDWKGKTFGADTNLSLTYFNRHVNGMANPFYVADGTMYYVSIGKGKIDGVEFEGSWAWKNWEFNQTVTYNNSHVTKWARGSTTIFNESDLDCPFPMIPEWETNSRLSYFFHDRKMSFFAEYHHTGKTALQVFQGKGDNVYKPWYDALNIFNVGFKYNPGSWKFTFGVNDLFNKGPDQMLRSNMYPYPINVFYPQQGRTFYFTTQYSF